ncbi:type II toxin-antitoxin system RelE/ParE family toxin [Corynebacterium hesseae]
MGPPDSKDCVSGLDTRVKKRHYWRGFKGYYSIRVNSQWRIIFKWTPEGAVDVDFIDYH